MNAIQALRAVEQGIVGRRSVAATNHAYAQYAEDMLPPSPDPRIEQGFIAGHDAAMRSVTALLNEVQTAALREDPQ